MTDTPTPATPCLWHEIPVNALAVEEKPQCGYCFVLHTTEGYLWLHESGEDTGESFRGLEDYSMALVKSGPRVQVIAQGVTTIGEANRHIGSHMGRVTGFLPDIPRTDAPGA